MAQSDRPMTAFVNLNELPQGSRTCELCENHFSDVELNGAPGYAIYPVRLLCGHICCYDCARMWIGHAKCPECNARFENHTIALEAIDEQIRQYRQYQVACFNGRLQAGMICAPPGYPTFAGQQAGPSKWSRWWHEDDTAKTAVSKPKSTRSDDDILAAQTLISMANSGMDDHANVSGGLSASSKMPSIKVTNPQGHAVGLERGMAARRLPNADIDDGETFAISKSEQTVKEFRTVLAMANKVSGTNYSRGDFPNMKLKYERKPRG